ncbi:hypothetical protein B0I72DRAFT_138413, partial [Yarrowia lipolytica]
MHSLLCCTRILFALTRLRARPTHCHRFVPGIRSFAEIRSLFVSRNFSYAFLTASTTALSTHQLHFQLQLALCFFGKREQS